MRALIATLLLFIASPVLAFQGMGPGPGVKGYASSGPSISYYFNCDASTTGQSPTIGSGTIEVTSGCSTVSGAVGNALYCTGDWEGIFIPVANLMSTAAGTLGMYVTPSASNGYMVSIENRLDWPIFVLSRGAGVLTWNYSSSAQEIAGISNGTRYFIEIAWDHANQKMAYRVDGSPANWTEITTTGSEPTSTGNVAFAGLDSMSASFDQILVSPTYKADIYAVRNNTSF